VELTFPSLPAIHSFVKPVYLIAPAIALIIAGGLVGNQRRAISQLENESVLLRKHITAEKSRADRQGDSSKPIRPVKPEAADDRIDWAETAEMFGQATAGGMGDMRRMMSFQSRLRKMDKDQLLAALDQIAALELGDDERMMLESMLIGPLAEKDPELLLERFSSRIGDERDGMSWQLANALGQWAKKDQAAAIAWFDKAIAGGTFDTKSLDGKSQVRLSFESNLINQLLASDPAAAAAGARVAALPADQRREALGVYGFQNMKEEGQAAHAELVRTYLPEDERIQVFGQQASMIAMMGSLEKVSGYLDRIGATGEERIKAAEKAASGKITSLSHQAKVTEEEVDSMRKWLGTQAPDSVDRVTGVALGEIAGRGGDTKFPEAAAMVLKYHEKTGSDDLLSGFIRNSYYSGDKEELQKMAEKISDPKQRAEAFDKLEYINP
jgi:hypothetical protein